MREIIFDTETTGLDPIHGHRIVEIGCVELIDRVVTGKTSQWYINPERDIPTEAFDIHGLSEAFLTQKPKFAEIAEEFLLFVGDAKLVAHNAFFDLKFINAELHSNGFDTVTHDRVIDTLVLARSKFPGAQHSLDALCKRFNVDLSQREKHGALLDAELLADVYIELLGGKQRNLDLSDAKLVSHSAPSESQKSYMPRFHDASVEEREVHEAFVSRMANAIWKRSD